MNRDFTFYVSPRPGCVVALTAAPAETPDEFGLSPTDEDKKRAIAHLRTIMDLLKRAAQELRWADNDQAQALAEEIEMKYGI